MLSGASSRASADARRAWLPISAAYAYRYICFPGGFRADDSAICAAIEIARGASYNFPHNAGHALRHLIGEHFVSFILG